jgi:peptide/nickel transport system substrate-binding protein
MTTRRGRRLCVVATVVLAVAACGCASAKTGVQSNGQLQLSAETPKAQGSLSSVTWDLPVGEPIPLDPTQDWNVSENQVLVNLCDQLFWVDGQQHIVPGLAASYTHPTPLTWVYQIRPGVTFWDGTSLTAADVVYSLQRQIDPKVGSFYLTPFGEMIARVQQTGPLEVTVTTKAPNVLVNEMMATGMGVITEKAFTERAGSSYGTPKGGVMCSGPFELEPGGWVPGQQLTIVKNPNYWNGSMVPKVDKITFKFVTDSATLTAALLSGEIDGTYDAPASAVGQLRSSSAGHLYLGPSTNLGGLVAIGGAKTQESQLLTALSLALDRGALTRVGFAGSATPQWSPNVFPIKYPSAAGVYTAYTKELERRFSKVKPNVEAAKQLVQKIGVPDHSLSLVYTAGVSTESAIATAIVAEAQAVGIPMKAVPLQPAEVSNLYLSAKNRQKYDFFLGLQQWEDLAEPLELIAINAIPGPVNLSGWSLPPAAMRQYQEALGTTDPERRAELSVAIDRVVLAAHRYIPLMFLPERLFLGKGVTGVPASWPAVIHYPWATMLGAAK